MPNLSPPVDSGAIAASAAGARITKRPSLPLSSFPPASVCRQASHASGSAAPFVPLLQIQERETDEVGRLLNFWKKGEAVVVSQPFDTIGVGQSRVVQEGRDWRGN